MSYGQMNVVIATMASADSVAQFDLKSYYRKVYLEIPTMASNSALQVLATNNPNDGFKQVMAAQVNTSTVSLNSFVIGATAAANGAIVPLPAGFRHYKIKATDSAPTAATEFKIIGAT